MDEKEFEEKKQELLEEQNKKIPSEEIEKDIEKFVEPEKQEKELDEKIPEEKKEEIEIVPKNKKAKEGSFKPMIIIMVLSLVIASFWDKFVVIKNSVHFILDPTAGALLNWQLVVGMLIIVFIITLITTLVQKYATDQATLKELRKEQKEIQKQMKEFRNHPEKMMELQKKQFALMPKQMKLSMRAIAYTGVPFILFFRWFYDFFAILGDPKFFGFLSWFWFYLISAMIFSSILRKQMDVV